MARAFKYNIIIHMLFLNAHHLSQISPTNNSSNTYSLKLFVSAFFCVLKTRAGLCAPQWFAPLGDPHPGSSQNV